MAPLVIAMLAGAGLGALKGNANVKKMAENDKYRKMAVAMSPWTGMGDPGSLNLEGPLGSALQGASLGGQVGGMMGGGATPATTGAGAENIASSAGMQKAGTAALGNQSQQLGARYGMMAPQQMDPSMLGTEDLASQYGQQAGSPGAMGSMKYNLLAKRF